jgi:uncharacterized protein
MSESSLFLYKIQPIRPEMLIDGSTTEEEEIIELHFAYLQRLTKAGIVLLAGRTLNTDPSSFGIIIFKAASEQDARQIMHNDPAVKRHVMRADLYPFRIALSGKLPETGE